MEHHRHQRAFEQPFTQGSGSLPGTLEVLATSIQAIEKAAGQSLIVRDTHGSAFGHRAHFETIL